MVEDGTNKVDEIEVHYAYERPAIGETTEFKGFELMDLIYEKATKNSKVAAFHEGCNPEAPYLDLEIRTIRITNISPAHYAILEENYLHDLEKTSIYSSIRYDEPSKSAEIYIEE
jgi:hypothetical protein